MEDVLKEAVEHYIAEVVGPVYSTIPGSGEILAVQLILHQMIYLPPMFFGFPSLCFSLKIFVKLLTSLKFLKRTTKDF